jgi:hypothetical protein
LPPALRALSVTLHLEMTLYPSCNEQQSIRRLSRVP